VYGAPTRARLWMHWTFHGHRYATRKLGRAKGSCGIVHKRLPFLPASARRGQWKIYVTSGKRLRPGRWLFGVGLNVF
jgi:hypothetical protein